MVLKIKDQFGNWIPISVLQGEKGPQGIQGIQGATGPSGENTVIVSYQNPLGLKVTKHLNVWNQTMAQLESCYWTWVMRVDDKLENPLGKYYMWYSTDHASDYSQYIGLAYSDSLTSGWTRYGTVFHHYDEEKQAYIGDETPSVIWDADNARFIMYSHGNGIEGESQTQYRSYSVDGITWTDTTKAFTRLDATRFPGNLHNGYFMPFCYMGSWFGYSLMGGGNGGSAFHWSEDGGHTWYTDHRQLGRWRLTDNDKWLYPNHSTPVFIMGQAYLLGVQSNFASGTTIKMARIVLTPLADLRTPCGQPYVLIDPTQGDSDYESVDLRTLTSYCEDGRIYVFYNCRVGDNWYNNCAVIELSQSAQPQPTPVILITVQPSNALVTQGRISGSLTVEAMTSDGSTIAYQWYSNTSANNTGGTPITGATSATMAIDTTLTAGSFFFYCVAISATAGTVASNVSTVMVQQPQSTPVILITAQPVNASVTYGSISGSLTVAASASDGSTVTYQWYSNTTSSNSAGTPITGATDSSIAIPTTLEVDSYYYYCVATSATAGTATSNVSMVTVQQPQYDYIAQYQLTGTPNASIVSPIADISGNGNAAAAVNGVTAFDAEGYINLDGVNGNSLVVSGLDLFGATSFIIHTKWLTKDGVTGVSDHVSHRLMYIASIDFNLMLTASGTMGVVFKVETTNTGYATTSGSTTGYIDRDDMEYLDIDITVIDDVLSFYGVCKHLERDTINYLTLNNLNVPGFTDALQTTLYIGNRADGARPVNGRITEFWIEPSA